MQVLNFFDTRSELILAHETIDVKTNEIPVAQALIPQLGLEGVIYTLDALHCQKKTFEIAGNENIEEKQWSRYIESVICVERQTYILFRIEQPF